MKRRSPISLVVAVLLLVAGLLWFNRETGPTAIPPAEAPAGAPFGPPAAGGEPSAAAAAPGATASGALLVRDVAVRDVDGRVAWRGDVDLAPVLERIEDGVRDPHRNDGGIFGNREGLLPEQRRGYYREYVVRTPGIDHAGPQRLIVGEGGELYYTADHYASFRRVR